LWLQSVVQPNETPLNKALLRRVSLSLYIGAQLPRSLSLPCAQKHTTSFNHFKRSVNRVIPQYRYALLGKVVLAAKAITTIPTNFLRGEV